MSTINLGKIISSKRREKGITQEELANHLGVSKPAVSKWESGQSYPDILLLPVLASYFNISIDNLIGYEPQMEKEDIRKLYHRLADDFAKKAFHSVYTECEEYVKKYFSCWYLQYQIGILYLNHSTLAGSPEQVQVVLQRAVEIFEAVEKYCEDISFAKQAMQLKAYAYLTLQKPVEAIDILEKLNEPLIRTETLLVRAYQMNGDNEKALEYLQGFTFENLNIMLSAAPDFFQMYADKPDKMDLFYEIFIKLIEVFELEQLYPAKIYSIYLVAAAIYVMQGRNEKALDVLEKYVKLAKDSLHDEFQLHGNRIFDLIENYLKTIDAELSAPRNAEVIWKDIKNVIAENPAFAALESEPRFHKIKRALKDL
jgi:transcriptional regulator with XRE-family HTH domain